MESDCVLWAERSLHNGYARVWIDGRRVMLHRKLYEDAHGPLAADMDVHHRCGVRNCLNLEHLQAVTHSEHGGLSNPVKTVCPQGHPMTPDNVYQYGSGGRKCRICSYEATKRWRASRKGAT